MEVLANYGLMHPGNYCLPSMLLLGGGKDMRYLVTMYVGGIELSCPTILSPNDLM